MPDEPKRPDYPVGIGSESQPDNAVCGSDFVRWVRRMDALNPDLPSTGRALLPRDEAVRFRQVPYTIFAPSTLARVDTIADGTGRSQTDLMVYFMGLLGPAGPLPAVYTDVVLAKCQGNPHPDLKDGNGRESLYRTDTGPAAFIDQFNHRFISFFYRASVAADKAIDFDRPADSSFRRHIGSFLGLGKSLIDRSELPDTVAFYFSAHFAGSSRHAEGLEAVVSDYFRVPARVMPNIGRWVSVPSADVTHLGKGSGGLGTGAILGQRFLDRTMNFRLVFGPMSLQDYSEFKPESRSVKVLKSLLLLYTGHELGCELQLVLRKEEVPELRLGSGLALGFSTWLRSLPASRDADSYCQQVN